MTDSSEVRRSNSSRSDRQRSAGLVEFIASWPSIGPLPVTRNHLFSRLLRKCGKRLEVETGVIFEFPRNIVIGSRTFINRGTIITARAPISIGDDVLIGPYVVINSGNHVIEGMDVPINRQGHTEAPISIAANVWIGAHACVLQGVSIGEGAVIGAGAVVTHDIPDRAIALGVPAKVIRFRGGSREA